MKISPKCTYASRVTNNLHWTVEGPVFEGYSIRVLDIVRHGAFVPVDGSDSPLYLIVRKGVWKAIE
jgi:hypothetical protein